MSRFRVLFAALLAVSVMAAFAVPASASVPVANNKKFCKAFMKIGEAGPTDSESVDLSTAKTTIAQYKAAAKHAPPKVKKAGEQIVSVFSKLKDIDPENAVDVAKFYSSSQFKNYGKAITTFFAYATKQCS